MEKLKSSFRLSQRLSLYTNTYSQAKQEGKLGGTAAFFMLFKGCVGMGFFSYPYIFSLTGIWLGTFLTISLCYLSTYGMYSIARVSTLIEEQDYKYGEMINDYNSKKTPN